MSKVDEKIINPCYYNKSNISVFDIIDAFELDFYSGNIIKYICRAGKKENNSKLQDLLKAQKYLQTLIDKCIWYLTQKIFTKKYF